MSRQPAKDKARRQPSGDCAVGSLAKQPPAGSWRLELRVVTAVVPFVSFSRQPLSNLPRFAPEGDADACTEGKRRSRKAEGGIIRLADQIFHAAIKTQSPVHPIAAAEVNLLLRAGKVAVRQYHDAAEKAIT